MMTLQIATLVGIVVILAAGVVAFILIRREVRECTAAVHQQARALATAAYDHDQAVVHALDALSRELATAGKDQVKALAAGLDALEVQTDVLSQEAIQCQAERQQTRSMMESWQERQTEIENAVPQTGAVPTTARKHPGRPDAKGLQ